MQGREGLAERELTPLHRYARNRRPGDPVTDPLTQTALEEMLEKVLEARCRRWERDHTETLCEAERVATADYTELRGRRPTTRRERELILRIAREWALQWTEQHGAAESRRPFPDSQREHRTSATARPMSAATVSARGPDRIRTRRRERRDISGRSSARSGDSGDDPGEPEPPQGGVDESGTSRRICGRWSA
jgi:hypothetical protein